MHRKTITRNRPDDKNVRTEAGKGGGSAHSLANDGRGQQNKQPNFPGPVAPMFLTEAELANRWNVSVKLLQKWRWRSGGPRYCKFGSAVRYAVSEIEEFEVAASRRKTSDGN